MEPNQTAARAARTYLDTHIRNDWSYPTLPLPRARSDEEISGAVALRERYYGESESGSSESEDTIEPPTGAGSDAAAAAQQTAYKFDSPDAIGDAVTLARVQRRKRRRARLEAEMAENEGLRIWVERRDAWTGARSVAKYSARRHPHVQALSAHKHSNATTGDADSGMHLDSDTALPTPPQDTTDTVPVAAPLLPQNPIRASITPKAYPDLYAKIVASSRTPAVPINLADMTRALVQGWKDTNEWPPKVGAVDPLAGRKRVKVLGVGAGTAGDSSKGAAGFIHRHPHLEKGVGSVKKILHFGGGNGDEK
ncbi:hypothetical protein E8E13_002863 [Curvularia kusanoi]|uniref:Gag1-like clamp domain-containing protein n=1 Tax=Curvularia kusanoi TaxID=90978 RepID=A0A9P4T5W2_CURKU|nr:hypothetical protein E8E13_002863 [Curvularia kusanoi]